MPELESELVLKAEERKKGEEDDVEEEEGKGLVRVVNRGGNDIGKVSEIVARLEDHKEEVRSGPVGRWWIDKRLRWNGDPLTPPRQQQKLQLLPPPAPLLAPAQAPSMSLSLSPMAVDALDAVDLWRQGVRCCPPVTISSSTYTGSVINRPRGCFDLSDMDLTTPTPPLELNSTTGTPASMTIPQESHGQESQTSHPLPIVTVKPTPTEAINESRLSWTFTQGWLSRLRAAQSFINRARMERQFEDSVGCNFERANLSEVNLDWQMLEKELGVERYLYRQSHVEYEGDGKRTWAEVVKGEKREEDERRYMKRGMGVVMGRGRGVYFV